MEQEKIYKLIGYAIVAYIAYQILQAIMPYLIFGLIGFVVLTFISKLK